MIEVILTSGVINCHSDESRNLITKSESINNHAALSFSGKLCAQ
jgi:hypothetical protein